MEKKYFTALIPASDLEMKLKKVQQNSNLYVPLPPIAPLEFYNEPISRDEFKINIDLVPDFHTKGLKKIDNWWVLELPAAPLSDYFTPKRGNIFGINGYNLLIGIEDEPGSIESDIKTNAIRNWELGFFELSIWVNDRPFNNIELTTLWRIKKRKLK